MFVLNFSVTSFHGWILCLSRVLTVHDIYVQDKENSFS